MQIGVTRGRENIRRAPTFKIIGAPHMTPHMTPHMVSIGL